MIEYVCITYFPFLFLFFEFSYKLGFFLQTVIHFNHNISNNKTSTPYKKIQTAMPYIPSPRYFLCLIYYRHVIFLFILSHCHEHTCATTHGNIYTQTHNSTSLTKIQDVRTSFEITCDFFLSYSHHFDISFHLNYTIS